MGNLIKHIRDAAFLFTTFVPLFPKVPGEFKTKLAISFIYLIALFIFHYFQTQKTIKSLNKEIETLKDQISKNEISSREQMKREAVYHKAFLSYREYLFIHLPKHITSLRTFSYMFMSKHSPKPKLVSDVEKLNQIVEESETLLNTKKEDMQNVERDLSGGSNIEQL